MSDAVAASRSTSEADGRRIAIILCVAYAFIGSAAPIAISIGGLAGLYLLGEDKSLATAPVTAFTIGVALGALPAAALMREIGRRSGFLSGALITAAGGLIASHALFQSSFWLFAFGLLVLGVGGAFVQQYRFAAADNSPASYRPQAISWVMAGGIFTAIIGPQTVIWTREAFAPVMFAGSFAAILALAAMGALFLSFLRLSKDTFVGSDVDDGEARPLGEILRQPKFIGALTSGVGAYAIMAFVMTGAPLAMVACGFSADQATLGISWHVMAMFAPSFFTGKLIARFGVNTILLTGMALLIGCAVVALSGIALWQFWLALILLGVGWNFAFIAATTMVTDAYRPSEKNKVQGIHDFILFGTVAFASLMSGQVFVSLGWDMLNWIVFPVIALCVAVLGWANLAANRTAA